MSHSTGRGLAAVLAAGVLAAGCTPDPGTDPSASPSPGKTTAVSSSPTRIETAEEQKQREAFEAAEKAYRANFAEVGRLSMDGGANAPTTKMNATATGNYLESSMLSLRSIKDQGLTASSPGSIEWVHWSGFTSTELILDSCEDYRKAVLRDHDGQVFTPQGARVYQQSITVRISDDAWKLSKKETSEVDQC